MTTACVVVGVPFLLSLNDMSTVIMPTNSPAKKNTKRRVTEASSPSGRRERPVAGRPSIGGGVLPSPSRHASDRKPAPSALSSPMGRQNRPVARVASISDGVLPSPSLQVSDRKRAPEGYGPDGSHRTTSRRRGGVANPLEVVGGRTFPGELSRYIVAGYANPRVFAGSVEPGPLAKGTRKMFVPTHGQVAAVIAKSIPKHLEDPFTQHFLRYQGAPETVISAVDDVIPSGTKICRTTYVASIHFAFVDTFGVGNVSVERCKHKLSARQTMCVGVAVPHILEVVVLDVVLGRSKNPPKPLSCGRATVDIPVKMHVRDDALVESLYDQRFRAMIVVLPEAGVFYCHRERRQSCVGVKNTHVPMDINWLRTLRDGTSDRTFASNGYATRLWCADSVWRWKISRGSSSLAIVPRGIPASPSVGVVPSFDDSRMKTVFHLEQCADEDAPRLPPDVVSGMDRYLTSTPTELRRLYLLGYVQSTSVRRGCRHYVKGFLHRHIDPESVFVVDAERDGDVDLNISTHIRHPKGKEKVALFRDSVVQVRHLPALGEHAIKLLGDIHDHASGIQASRGSRGVRANLGDSGSMHPVGLRIMRDRAGPWRTRYVASSKPEEQPALASCVCAASQLASVSVPAVLRVMQDMEDDADIKPQGGMAGDGAFARVSHTMDVSVDLCNASHYDANDASQSFSIWTEDFPGTTSNWYFVLPNVFGKKSVTGRTYNGVAIKLTHGTLISWDGRLIRHCTSMMERRPGSHVYGTFFGAKTSVVHYAVGRAIESERQRRAYVATLPRPKEASEGDGPVVDMVPVPESKVIIDSDDIALDGSVSSAASDDDSDGWIAKLGSDMHLGDDTDDDGSVDDGVPASDAIIDDVSDGGLWDEPEIAMWRIPRRSSTVVDDAPKSDTRPSIVDKHVPDLMARRMGSSTCGACDSLCTVSGDGRLRDALRFVSSGGPLRDTVDAREMRHPDAELVGTSRQRLQPFCPFLAGRGDGDRVQVRVYYPYFRDRKGERGSLYDIFPPRQVTALHLIRASRLVLPCPHLQFHFEEFWKLLLPEHTTLRTGIEWIDGVAWYYVQMVKCRTKHPHALSLPPAYDTWLFTSMSDWREFDVARGRDVMVGVSGHCAADARMVAIQSVTPGTYLGAKALYFPSERLREVFARKFEPYLPTGSHTSVGNHESDGSAACPHGVDHRNLMYYYMMKVTDDSCVSPTDTIGCPTRWSLEVTSGAQGRYGEDDEFFSYDLDSELYDQRFRWYEHRFDSARDVAPDFRWGSLCDISDALRRVFTLHRTTPTRLGEYPQRDAESATETLIHTLDVAMRFALRFATVFDRMCLCVMNTIPCLPGPLVDRLLSAFASMVVKRVPEVIPRYAFACDDAFLLESLALNSVDRLPFGDKDEADIRRTFQEVMPRPTGVGGRSPDRAATRFAVARANAKSPGVVLERRERRVPVTEQLCPSASPQRAEPVSPWGAPSRWGKLVPAVPTDPKKSQAIVMSVSVAPVMLTPVDVSPADAVGVLIASQTVGEGDDVRLVHVDRPEDCIARCSMMWNLRNSRWCPRGKIEDRRFAHPVQNAESALRDVDVSAVVNAATAGQSSNNATGCNGRLVGRGLKMSRDVLGWVTCIGGEGPQTKRKHTFMFPTDVTIDVVHNTSRLVVPCEHLQLFFEIMMGRTLYPHETLAIGFSKHSKKLVHRYIERRRTRTAAPLPSWDPDDCSSLMDFWDEPIIVTYFARKDERDMQVRDTVGDVGVNETTHEWLSIRKGFTPATFLGCSYILVDESKENVVFGARLRAALLKRLPTGADIRVKSTDELYAERGVPLGTPGKYHLILQWMSSTDDECSSDESGYSS